MQSDVFLICSNAMQYNSAETVYHKQVNALFTLRLLLFPFLSHVTQQKIILVKARAIQELATKKFHRLRVGIERAEKEAKAEKELKLEKEQKLEKDLKSEQKVKPNFWARRQTKKPFSRTIQEPVGSDFSSGATLATAGEIQNGSVATTNVAISERPSYTDGLVDGTCVFDNQDKAEDLSSGMRIKGFQFDVVPFPKVAVILHVYGAIVFAIISCVKGSHFFRAVDPNYENISNYFVANIYCACSCF